MTAIFRLTVLTGPHKGSRFCCRQRKGITLGRAADCEICLNGAVSDPQVSRHHCQLQFTPESILVHDLASRNGTFLNGQVVNEEGQPCNVLESGDLLTIGETTLELDLFNCPLGPYVEGESAEVKGQGILKNCPRNC